MSEPTPTGRHVVLSRTCRRGLVGGVRLGALLTATLLLACGEIRRDPYGAMTVTVKPGQTGTCAISPCRVLFEMPLGSSDYQIRGNEIDFGRYPAGKTVNLGDFYDPIAIQVVGANVPKTYVYIPVVR